MSEWGSGPTDSPAYVVATAIGRATQGDAGPLDMLVIKAVRGPDGRPMFVNYIWTPEGLAFRDAVTMQGEPIPYKDAYRYLG